MKEILIYGRFHDYMAESYMREMESLKDEDIVGRILSNGGDPEVSYGMISKWQSHTGVKTTMTDGYARSTAAYFLCYTDYNKCLDVSKFLYHRAAFPSFIENDPNVFTEERKKELNTINSELRAALEGKVNVKSFERITGVTLDQLFSLDGRIDVKLDARQAKKVGLIDEIIDITPVMRADIEQNSNRIQAQYNECLELESNHDEKEVKITDKAMDLNKLKAEHPHVYAEVLNEGVKIGKKQENERVEAFMVFADVDLQAVKDGIKGSDPLSTVKMAEFTRKMASAEYLSSAESDSQDDVSTEASAESSVEKTEAEKEIEAFEAEVRKDLQLN